MNAQLGAARSRLAYDEAPIAMTLVFMFFVLIRYMEWNQRVSILATIRFEFIVGVVLLVMSLFVMTSLSISLNRSQSVIAGAVLLLIAMGFGVPFALIPEIAKKTFIDRGIKFAMLMLFIVVFVRSPRTMYWFISAFMLSIGYLTQESLRGALTGSMIWENQGIQRLHGSVPSVYHPNSLGSAILGVVPFCMFLIPVVRRRWLKLVMLALIPMALMVVMYSGSRTAYVGAFFMVAIWYFFQKHKMRWAVIGLVVAIATIPLIPDDYVSRFSSIGVGKEEEGASSAERMLLNRIAWQTFLDSPGGVGVRSFPEITRVAMGTSMEVHCLYLEILSHIGIQGFIAFGIFVGSTLMACFRARSEFRRQRRHLRLRVRELARLPADYRSVVVAHDRDLERLTAITEATLTFLIIRLVVGLFSQDLYEIYWWFGGGIAISLSGLILSTQMNTDRILVAGIKSVESVPADSADSVRSE